MKVHELIAALEKMPRGAEVTVNGRDVQGVEKFKARMKEGYGFRQYTKHERGQYDCVGLGHQTELTDGIWHLSLIWNA